MHCDWFILPLLLPAPTIWFSLDGKRRSRNRSRKKWKRSDYSYSDTDALMTPTPTFHFHKVIGALTTSHSDSVSSENQPLVGPEKKVFSP